MPSGKKLTPSFISRLPLRESGQEWHWDSMTVGLGLQVGKTAKSYVVQFRGKRLTLGRADVLTLDEARSKAIDYIRSTERGEDPRAQQTAARTKGERLNALTLRAALEETIASKGQFIRPRTQRDYRNSVRLYLDCWLDRPLHTITANDVSKRFNDIIAGRNLGQRKDGGKYSPGTDQIQGGRSVAAKAMVVFRLLYNHMRWQHSDLGLPECPIGVLGKLSKGWAKTNARDRIVTDVPRFIAAAKDYPSPVQSDLVLFLLGTGLRMSEGCQLRWDEVSLEDAKISIPAERMKANRPLVVPLARMALEALQRRAADGRDSSGYVFIGRRAARGVTREGFATLSKAFLRYLAEKTGEAISAHDLRRTWTSTALKVGIPLHIVEYLTAHAPHGVTLTHYWSITMDELRVEVAKIDAALRAN